MASVGPVTMLRAGKGLAIGLFVFSMLAVAEVAGPSTDADIAGALSVGQIEEELQVCASHYGVSLYFLWL